MFTACSESTVSVTNDMDIYETRRANLKLLIEESFKGKKGEFAKSISREQSYVSRLLTENGIHKKNLGHALAREIEQATGKPPGWLDKGHEVSNIRPARPDTRRIPVISYVQAGNPKEVINDYARGAGFDTITTDLDLGPDAFAQIIEGNSMEPDFKEGDKVIIDPSVEPRPGSFVVAKCHNSEKTTFKKYRPRGVDEDGKEIFELVPLNDDYPVITSTAKNPCVIIGTMVEHRRYFR